MKTRRKDCEPPGSRANCCQLDDAGIHETFAETPMFSNHRPRSGCATLLALGNRR